MRFRLVVNGEAHEVVADGAVTVDGRELEGTATPDPRGATVRIGRKRYRVLLTRWGCVIDSTSYRVEVHDLVTGAISEEIGIQKARAGGSIEVHPPMPGRIVRVLVKTGDRVARSAPVAVLEAMKMQNEIPAPAAGVVKEVLVAEGQGVLASDVLVVLGPE